MIHIIVVTHGEFGSYLIEAAEGIVGRQEEGVHSIGISSRVTVEEVGAKLKSALNNVSAADVEGAVIVVDMPGGTPCNIVMPLVQTRSNVRVLSGLNLYILVTAFSHRKNATLDSLAEKMLSAGRRSIADIQSMLNEKPKAKV